MSPSPAGSTTVKYSVGQDLQKQRKLGDSQQPSGDFYCESANRREDEMSTFLNHNIWSDNIVTLQNTPRSRVAGRLSTGPVIAKRERKSGNHEATVDQDLDALCIELPSRQPDRHGGSWLRRRRLAFPFMDGTQLSFRLVGRFFFVRSGQLLSIVKRRRKSHVAVRIK